MSAMRRLLAVISLLFASLAACALDLREELSKETFLESGLDKLTEEELLVLNAAVEGLLNNQEDVLRAENSLPVGVDFQPNF